MAEYLNATFLQDKKKNFGPKLISQGLSSSRQAIFILISQ
jgi:hypothetical protein